MSDAIQNFSDAIQNYSDDALGMFQSARQLVQTTHPPAAAPGETPAQKSAREAAEQKLKQAQAQLQGAFTQLSQAAAMESDEQGRNGYTAIVQLMTSTAKTAALVCGRLDTLTVLNPPTPAQYDNITMLVNVLGALASVSPIAVWQKAFIEGSSGS